MKMRSIDFLMSLTLKEHQVALIPHLSHSVIHRNEGEEHNAISKIDLKSLDKA